MMKKLKFLALLLFPLFLAVIIPKNAEAASSGCGYITFNQYVLTASGDTNKDTKETVRSPKLCISNLDDNGNITKDSELTKTSQGWDLFDFMLMNKKQTKLTCNSKDWFNSLCNDTTYSLDDMVGQNYTLFFNHLESPIRSYYGNGHVGDQVNGQAVVYEYQNVVSESLNATDPNNPNGDNPDGSEGENGENGENGKNSEEQQTNDLNDNCYDSGIDSMGWIICPTINNVSQASDGIMGLITEWLSVKPDQTFNDGIREGWGIFRNLSNIIVTIMLIVIIFSQITGVGIDNYGIKKTLPRLIIVSILINFSYIICEVAVDLSNILGQGLFELFKNISDAIPGSAPGQNNLVPLGITAAVIAVLGLVATGVIAGVAGVISLLLSLLLGLVSILFFFVMLAARSMAVVVLVLISPLAFACYMLPNTQNLFTKWWKMLQSCLIIYPICGALYGASFVIADIAANGNSWFWSIIGLCAPFLPFLAVPALLKNAIAGLGVVGGALTTITSTAKGAAKTGVGAIRKSDTYQNFQHRHKAGVDREGHQTRAGAWRSAIAQTRAGRFFGMNSMMQSNMGQAAKDRQTAHAGDVAMMNARAKREIAERGVSPQEYYEQEFDDAARRGDTDAMTTALDAAVESGYFRPGQLANMVRNAQNNPGVGINIEDERARAEWLRDTAAKYGENFLSKDNELRTWMQNGGETTYTIDHNGNRRAINLGQVGEYASSHRLEADPNNPGQTRLAPNQTIGVDDIKKEDIPKLSAQSLAGLIAAGSISQGTARQAIADNPNMDASSRVLLGAYADGAIDQNSIDALQRQIENNRDNDNYNGPNSVAQALVEDANAHARGHHNPNVEGGPQHQLIRANHDQVDRWTRPAPQRVEVVPPNPHP